MKKLLSKLGAQALDNFFMAKELALEESPAMGVFSKQMGLQKLQAEVETFIKLNPHGRFQIEAADEKNKQPVILVVTNCPEELVRHHYLITINPEWSGAVMEQLSESGAHRIRVHIIES